MTLEQRCRMLQSVTGVDPIPPAARQCLAGLVELTVGDFAAVVSGLDILGRTPSVEVVLDGLREEVAAGGARPEGIGFLRVA